MNTPPLLTVMYLSQSLIESAEVDELVSYSLTNNLATGVTGAMLFTGRYFVQIIEGAPDTVEKLIARIRKDSRHHKMKVILRKPTTKRTYQKWSMGYVVLPFADQAIVPLLGDSPTDHDLQRLEKLLLTSVIRNEDLGVVRH
jgi:hypothetical protein